MCSRLTLAEEASGLMREAAITWSGHTRIENGSHDPWARKGKGPPLCPCTLVVGDSDHGLFSSGGGLRFLRMDSPRISMRWAL
jgi:hypothetical protein